MVKSVNRNGNQGNIEMVKVNSNWSVAVALGLMMVAPAAANAGNADAGLYAAAPPPNSVFVRIVCAAADGHAAQAVIGKAKYSASAGTASVYKVVPAGKATVQIGTAAQAVTLTDGRYYTVVVSGPAAKPAVAVIEDPRLDSKVKGLITFYNLTARPSLTLKTADGKAAVVAGVTPGHVGSRSVNSATTGFSVVDGNNAIGQIPAQTVERGNAYSSIVTEIGGKPKVAWVRSETGK